MSKISDNLLVRIYSVNILFEYYYKFKKIKFKWEKEYHNVRMLEIDSNSSFGTVDVRLSETYTNAAEIIWNGSTGASIFFRCNCTSTAFATHKQRCLILKISIDIRIRIRSQKNRRY